MIIDDNINLRNNRILFVAGIIVLLVLQLKQIVEFLRRAIFQLIHSITDVFVSL